MRRVFINDPFNTASIPDYARVDRVFPVFVATMTLAGAVILLVQMMLANEGHLIFADREAAAEPGDNAYSLWPTLAWFAFLLAMTAMVGFILALGAFLLTFFRIRAQLSWIPVVTLTRLGLVFMCFMAWTLNRDFPPGLLQAYVDLPWPLG